MTGPSHSRQDLRDMPELAAFDGDPELQELAARVFGEPVLSYDFTDPATATNTLLSLILRERVRRLESAIETIEAQARCARAAQERWRALLHAGGDIVFVNMVGDTARIPSEIVDLIGRHAPVDVVVVEEAEHVAFKQGGRTVARVPKSLLVVLPDLLERGLWEAPKSSSRRSQSHQSRGNAAGGEGVSRG